MKVSGQDTADNQLSCKVRSQVLLVVSAIAIFYAVWFGINHWLNGFLQPAAVNLAMSAMILVNALIAFKRPDCRVPRLFIVLISSLFFLYLFAMGIAGDGAAMWGLIVPIASFFLCEFKIGMAISLFYLCGCLLTVWLSKLFPEIIFVYDTVFINRFFGVYAMIFVVAGGYEFCRSENEKILMDLLADSKRAQIQISESEAKYRALFDGSGHGIVVSRSCDGRIIDANASAQHMFGLSSEELPSRRIESFYERSEEVLAVAPSPDKAGREVWRASNLVCHKLDKTRFFADLYVTRIRPGDLDLTVYFFSDVTERMLNELELKSAREKACAASDAKSGFLANISHEIRTPLNGIIGVSELLDDTPLNSEQQEYLDIVRSSGETLLALINGVLDLAKIEAGRTELKPESFEMASFFREITMEMRLRALQKGLIFDFDMTEGPSHLYCDRLRFRQVLNNLLGNAIKFTNSNGWVGLNVTFESDAEGRAEMFLKAEVTDTGIGISQDDMAKLFQDFNQVDSSNTRKFGGTGLGLAISRRLVEMMGGEIGVESEPGRGSKFWFRIPVGCKLRQKGFS